MKETKGDARLKYVGRISLPAAVLQPRGGVLNREGRYW
jgi:hypothetical protein